MMSIEKYELFTEMHSFTHYNFCFSKYMTILGGSSVSIYLPIKTLSLYNFIQVTDNHRNILLELN